jgi:hypothetical protein
LQFQNAHPQKILAEGHFITIMINAQEWYYDGHKPPNFPRLSGPLQLTPILDLSTVNKITELPHEVSVQISPNIYRECFNPYLLLFRTQISQGIYQSSFNYYLYVIIYGNALRTKGDEEIPSDEDSKEVQLMVLARQK